MVTRSFRTGDCLVGREGALETLSDHVDRALAGHGIGVLLVGEAGAGKTALFDAFRARQSDCRVLWTCGSERDSAIPWLGLTTLLRPLLKAGNGTANDLPPLSAVGASFSPLVPSNVAVATLNLLASAADDDALLLMVDDWHWLDEESRAVIGFVFRRLRNDRVALVAASREEWSEEGPILQLEPLSLPEGHQLLRALGVASPHVRQQVLDHLGTSPGLLHSVGMALRKHEVLGAGWERLLPRNLVHSDRIRIAGLAVQARTALAFLGVLPFDQARAVRHAFDHGGLPLDDLAEAERMGIVEASRDVVRFRHPTLAWAARSTDPAMTRRMRRRVADLPGLDPVQGALVLVGATVGNDPETAGRLRAAAILARDGGDLAAAATLAEEAAGIEPDLFLRAGDLDRAGRDWLAADRTDRAAVCMAARSEFSVEVSPQSLIVTAAIAQRRGHLDEALDHLGRAAASTTGHEMASAYIAMLPVYVRRADLHGVRRVSEALQIIPGLPEPLAEQRLLLSSALALLRGRESEVVVLRRLDEVEVRPDTAEILAEVLAPIISYSCRSEAALRFLEHLGQRLRELGHLNRVVPVLGSVAAHWHGRNQPRALAAAAEATSLADDLGTPAMAALARQTQATAAAAAGDRDTASLAIAALRADRDRHALVIADSAEAHLLLASRQNEAAVEILEGTRSRVGLGSEPTRWEADYLEALVRCGQTDRAEQALQHLARVAQPRSSGYLARARLLLADGEDEALTHLDEATGFAQASNNLVLHGRALLCWGERLRRARRRAAARNVLRSACELFATAGARLWEGRAEEELTLSGGSVRSPGESFSAALSPAETRVLVRVITGAGNREIARALFLSERTIETHLTSIYRKLGVNSRGELFAASAEVAQGI